jgi:hypothetical protein
VSPQEILGAAEASAGFYSRWREQLPFLDDTVLDHALDEVVQRLVPDPPWRRAELQRGIIDGLRAFAAAQRRSLPLGLPLAGSRHMDTTGIVKVAEGLVLPEEVRRQIAPDPRTLSEFPLGALGESACTDRIYWVRLFNGIDPRAVPWWPGAGGPPEERHA